MLSAASEFMQELIEYTPCSQVILLAGAVLNGAEKGNDDINFEAFNAMFNDNVTNLT